MVIEALARVRTNLLSVTIANAQKAWVIAPLGLTDTQRDNIVSHALPYSADTYNYLDIGLQGLNALCRTTWFTDHLTMTRKPICSMLVAVAYEAEDLTFGQADKTTSPNDIWNYASAHPEKYSITELV
jgi:hypothetical protein